MATLNLQVIFDAKDKITGPMKAIIGGSNELTKAFKKTNAELKNLKDQQNAVNRYRELSTQIGKTTADINKHKQIISELKTQGKLGSLTQEQSKALSGSEAALKRLNKEYQNNSSRVTDAVRDMQQYGYTVKDLDHQESQLKDKLFVTTMELNKRRGALDNAAKAQEKYARTQAILQKGSDIAKKGMMVAGAGAAALVVPAKLSIDFESSMADIAKVVDGLKDETGKITPAYAAMSKEIIAMSSRLPMAANDIAAIVAAGGQSGIAANELTRFAESAIKMGVAFDISADEAGQAMAEMRTAFKLSQNQVVELADKINYLGNSTPQSAKKIMEITQRVGPLANLANIASGDVAALGASMVSLEPDVAATAIKKVIGSLTAGESASKSMRAAYEELGLDVESISKSVQKDSTATLLTVLNAIKKLPRDKQVASLSNIFGLEGIGGTSQLADNMDNLIKNLNAVGDATKYAGSMEKEYAARAATTANKLKLALNAVQGLGITIGNNLLPIISNATEKFAEITNRVTAWANENPALASTITKVAVGAIAIIGGVSALALGVITLLGPLAMLKMTLTTLGGGAGIAAGALKMMLAPMKMVGTAIMMTGKAFLWAGKALLANPMILAVTLLATAAYLIYRNWTPIKAFFSNLWTGIKSAFSTGINYIKGVFQSLDAVFANNPILNLLIPFIGIPRIIIANWSTISGFFGQIWSSITSMVNTGITAVSGVISTGFNAVSTFMASVWSRIKGIVSTAWSVLCNIFLTVTPLGFIIRNFDQIIGFLTGLASRFLSIGRNIVDGLIKGILSGFDKLKGVWQTINNWMPDFTKKKMVIRSPSRVMAGLGGHIVDGIGVGINSAFPALKKQYRNVLDLFNNNYVPKSNFTLADARKHYEQQRGLNSTSFPVINPEKNKSNFTLADARKHYEQQRGLNSTPNSVSNLVTTKPTITPISSSTNKIFKIVSTGMESLQSIWTKIKDNLPESIKKPLENPTTKKLISDWSKYVLNGIGLDTNAITPALQNQFGNTLNTFSDQSPIRRLAGNNQNTPTLKQTPALSTKSSVIFQSNDQYTIHVSVDKDMKVEDRRSIIKEIREELDRRDREKQAIIRRHLGDQE